MFPVFWEGANLSYLVYILNTAQECAKLRIP
jgi:hypothetical protein